MGGGMRMKKTRDQRPEDAGHDGRRLGCRPGLRPGAFGWFRRLPEPANSRTDGGDFAGSGARPTTTVRDRRYRWGNTCTTVLRLALAVVFIVAGALKIVDPIGFARNITDYDLVPETLVPVIAVVLPWWEVVAGALAVVGRWKVGALAALTGMSAAFLVMGGITLARGLSVECGCFGFLSERVGVVSVSVEAALLIVSAWLLWREMLSQPTGGGTQ